MYDIVKYDKLMVDIWDDFVMNNSENGTFLQSKNFLNYHSMDKFVDHSIIVKDKMRIVCVIPACEYDEKGEKVFCSHRFSTFGGIIITSKYMRTDYIQKILLSLEAYCITENFQKIILKQPSNLFARVGTDLLEFMFCLNDYEQYCELNTYINYRNYDKNIINNFNKNKKRIIRHMSDDIKFSTLNINMVGEKFYEILANSLLKYGELPKHSVSELIELKKNRLCENLKFFGIYYDNILYSVAMVFEFVNQNTKIAHTQYLASDNKLEKPNGIEPMVYLYYHLIEYYKQENFESLSWGIATECCGEVLNWGLIKNKESYGSEYSLNKAFYKNL